VPGPINFNGDKNMTSTAGYFIRFIAITTLIGIFSVVQAGSASEDPNASLEAANESFLKHDTKAAEAYIHKAGEAIRKEGAKAGAKSKEAFDKIADETDKLAKDVKSGAVKTNADLKKRFAKINHSLAKTWHKVAGEANDAGEDTKEAMKKAAHSVSAAADWTGTKLKAGTHKTVEEVKGWPDDAEVAADKAGAWFKGIGDGIKDVGQNIQDD